MNLPQVCRFATLLFAALLLTFTACKNRPDTPAHLQEVDKTGKEYTSLYICPMHCVDSGSEAAGQCPVCGMDYVENKDYVAPVTEEIVAPDDSVSTME